MLQLRRLNFTASVSSEVDAKEWDQKLPQSTASTTYQISYWARVYESFDSRPIFISVRNSTGEIIGQLLALIHNELLWSDSNLFTRFIGSKLNLRQTLTWFYGPIIHDSNHADEIFSKILLAVDEVSIKNKVTIARGSSHPYSRMFSDKVAQKLGYKLQPWSTYITDLHRSSEELHNSLDKKTRYDIRKSEKNQLEFVAVNNRSSLDEFVELKAKEREKVGQRVDKNPDFYDDRWEYLHKNGYEKLFLAKYKGKTLAGILNIIFNGNVVQHGVSISSHRELLGGPFLTWNTIQWCIDNKYSTYDMGGINPNPENEKEKSMNFYKSKWGGKKSDYIRYTKIYDITKWKISSGLKNPKKLKKILK